VPRKIVNPNPYLVEKGGEGGGFLGRETAEDEDAGAVGQMEGVEDPLTAEVGGTDVHKGEVVQHVFLGEGWRGQQEIEAVDEDFRKHEEGGDEENGRFLDFHGPQLLVVQESVDAPGFSKEEPKNKVQGKDLEPGPEETGGVRGNGREGKAAHGKETSECHACGGCERDGGRGRRRVVVSLGEGSKRRQGLFAAAIRELRIDSTDFSPSPSVGFFLYPPYLPWRMFPWEKRMILCRR